MAKRVTQKVIADRLGVSPSLVSRALLGTADRIGASPETIRRIREEAEKLHYQPDGMAQALRGSGTRMLGIAVRDFDDPFIGSLVGELNRLARAAGYTLLVTGCAGEPPQPDQEALARYRVDGVVLAGSDFTEKSLAALARLNVPCVLVGQGICPGSVSQVKLDIAVGLRGVARHLAGLGHRRFGFVGAGTERHRARAEKLRQILAEEQLEAVDTGFVLTTAVGADVGYQAMAELMDRCGAARPTAVVCANDLVAIQALRLLHERGVRVPHDLSLVGVDDIPVAHAVVPALTTLRQPVAELAARAFEALMAGREAAEGATAVAGVVMVQPELVVRESTGPAT